ncbi:MAG: hypothetical protein LBC63_03215 [Holophagales bacterium]|jgi:pentatricopeptide repeat protein|nr:hypothetical protein [Holophagales bacterium]
MCFVSFKRLLAAAMSSIALAPLLFSQTDFDVNIARYKGNKIVLLGEWKPDDIAKWNQTLGSDEIFGHGFILLDRAKLVVSKENFSPFVVRDINAFESWFRQKYGISGADTWTALDFGNKFIVSGQQAPSPKELDQMLERRGIKTPARQLRDFLRENPGHLDATRDLLNEVRRRALSVMPKGVDKDLEDETDLRTWAVMASETDKVFSGSWLGVNIDFFSVDLDQPEKYSKQMRAVFRKRIPKVESELRQDPTNYRLWNIWAWMARGMGGYNWTPFVNSLELIDERFGSYSFYCPDPEVCVWLVAESKAKKDWSMVDKLARIARRFGNVIKGSPETVEWTPGGGTHLYFIGGSALQFDKHPFASAFAPHLEALLRLGRIDEANAVYDEMLRWDIQPKNGRVQLAVGAAKAVGKEEVAKLWEKGELINKVPYRERSNIGEPFFVTFAEGGGYYLDVEGSSDYVRSINEVLQKLNPPNKVSLADPLVDNPTLGWRKADGRKWGLFREDGTLIAQGGEIPDVETLQRLWDRLNVVGPTEWFRAYIAQHTDQPKMAFTFSSWTIGEIISRKSQNRDITMPWPFDGADWLGDYEKSLGEALGILRRAMNDLPGNLDSLPSFFSASPDSMAQVESWLATLDESSISSIKAISGPLLSAIESGLEMSPSSGSLWNNWLFWRIAEGRGRPMEPLVARLKYSPLSANSMGLPIFVLDMYLDECKKNGNWAKVAELLKGPWERELSRAVDVKNGLADGKDLRFQNISASGDNIGIPLIEAYLNDDRPGDANDVFNAWLDTGNTFKDVSAIVSLATAKGRERLAKEWEAKVKK